MKKIIYLEIAGGTGAQIIGSCVAEFLSCNHNIVICDYSYFNEDSRKYYISGIRKFPLQNEYITDKPVLMLSNRLISRFFRKIIKILAPISFKRLIIMNDENKEKVICLLKNMSSMQGTSSVRKLKKNIENTSLMHDVIPTNVVHLRRGDFANAQLPMLSVTKLNQIINNSGQEAIDIVTDDPDTINTELNDHLKGKYEIHSGNIYQDLKILSSAENFIASESQFSLLALLLRKNTGQVYLPRFFYSHIENQNSHYTHCYEE